MKNALLAIITLSLILSACSQKEKSIRGYKYEISNSTGDRKPLEGEYVYFGLIISDQNDSILQEMTEAPQLPIIKIGTEAELEKEPIPVGSLLKTLSVGDVATLYIPVDSMKNSGIDVNKFDLIKYKIDIREVMNQEEYDIEAQRVREEMAAKAAETQKLLPEITQNVEDFLQAYNGGESSLQTTSSGLQYQIIEQGDGVEINVGTQADVHYYGALMDGVPFDNSYRTGTPYGLRVGTGSVIKGWDEGLQLLNGGGKAFLVIPADLAYGATGSGSIPPDATIMFYVHVVNAG